MGSILDDARRLENEAQRWRRDGTYFEAEYWSYPYVQHGEVRGAVVTFIDITELKRYQNRLKRAKREAEAASRTKSEFLANMSTRSCF